MQTGIAIANPTSSAVEVTLQLSRLDGVATGASARLQIPANGQQALFLSEFPEFVGLVAPFQGVLRITAATPIAVTSLRTRVNERGDFLITTTTPADESRQPAGSELVFPHWVDGGGYSTQFLLFGRATSGTVNFFNQSGQPVNLVFR
jgi:hypothetical protein